jgi:D-alanyl-D-alanine dipeptidase
VDGKTVEEALDELDTTSHAFRRMLSTSVRKFAEERLLLRARMEKTAFFKRRMGWSKQSVEHETKYSVDWESFGALLPIGPTFFG